jgi:hypothetical protein
MDDIKKNEPLTPSKHNFLRLSAEMHSLNLAKNGAKPQNVILQIFTLSLG